MKKRKTILILTSMLVVLLVVGGTMAWFTAETRVEANEFKAGTLEIKLDEYFDECNAQNVNPGDCYKKHVKIKNTGTKRAFVRIKKDMVFDPVLPIDGVVKYTLGTGWVEHNGYFYYTRMLNAKDRRGRYDYTSDLFKADRRGNHICFDGAKMTNDYQGAKFTINIKGEAVQVTNGAPGAVWGVNPMAPGTRSIDDLVIEREILEEEAILEMIDDAQELEEVEVE